MQWFSQVASLVSGGQTTDTLPQTSHTANTNTTPSRPQGRDNNNIFAVGDTVEYFSSSTGTWITAKVLAVNPSGTYNLDCKPDVVPEKMRHAVTSAGNNFGDLKYAVGDMVEYHSATHGWIPAKVLGMTAKGTCNLDCKPDVPNDKVRRRSSACASFEPSMRNIKHSNPNHVSFGEGGFRPEGAPTPTRARSYKADGSSPPEPPVQLLSIQRQGQGKLYFQVCPEGAKRLERYGNRRIAVIAVCGPRRTGKSSLLNLFLQQGQQQHSLAPPASMVRNGNDGLWLFGTSTGDDESGPVVAFLDCEGITDSSDESEQARSAQLLTLCGLLSSVLILNTKGMLNDNLLKNLMNSCRFADHTDLSAGSVTGNAGHANLVWLLRDFMLELRDSSGRPVTPDEYLDKALCTFADAGGDLKQRLRNFFSQQSCATLVRPSGQESQLENLPYSSLGGEFRAGVEALQAQLMASCRASPKTVGGQPLSCVAFIALVNQLLASMNNQLPLNLKIAWDTAQHGRCSGLADRLRGIALVALKTLQAGEKLPGGAQLPMSDEALRMVLRQQRHELKSQWDEQAVGEESVRREYWQELKESFARDERMVVQQNAKLADLRLKDILNEWQRFLDDDSSAHEAAGERVAADFGLLMERMPTLPLSRAARAAIEGASRRVTAARAQLGVAGGGAEVCPKSSPTFHSKNTSAESDLRETQSQLHSHQLQLQDAKSELERLLADVEAARVREQELKTHQREAVEKEAAWRAELENFHVAAANAQANHLHSERLLKTQLSQVEDREHELRRELEQLRGQGHDDEKLRLRAELESARGHVAAKGEMEAELEAVRLTQAAERARLEEELALARTHAASRGQLEADLEQVHAAQDKERAQLEAELQQVRGHAAERDRVEADLERLRASQAAERKRLEAELLAAQAQGAQKVRLEAELEQARILAAQHMKLQAELEHVRAEAEEYKDKLSRETGTLKTENEKTRSEHLRMLEEAQRRLEEERKAHADKLGGERNRLLERERDAGVLEGRVDAISTEANGLRERISELQQQVVDVEGERGKQMQEKEQLRKDLENSRKAQEAEVGRKKQPKCGCVLQ